MSEFNNDNDGMNAVTNGTTGGLNRRQLLTLAAAVAAGGVPALSLAQAETKKTSGGEKGPGVPIVTKVVPTKYGRVQGLVNDGVHTFKGVRYAAAPVGELRFMPPQKPEAWTTILDCSDYGAPAMQLASGTTASPVSDFGMQMSRVFTTPSEIKIQNEDCLFLNVWTPNTDTKKRAVMFWIHGGGYAYGSGGQPIYCGEDLAREYDVTVVSVNHRLNVFGYLYLGDLMVGEQFKGSGTVGMQDLVAALEWVRDNIAEFGGDPGNVTIMGQSGGGLKVCNLLAMPSAKGLFHKASIQSGASPTVARKEAATRTAKAVLDELKIVPGDIKALQAVPAQTLLQAARKAGAMSGGFNPILDGVAITRDPFAPDSPDASADVPILLGFVKDEMTIFTASEPWYGTMTDSDLTKFAAAMPKGPALLAEFRKIYPDYSPTYLRIALMSALFGAGSYTVADRKVAKGKAPVYMWFMKWETPVNKGILKTPHTIEIPFMLNSYNRVRAYVGPGDGPKKMAQQLAGAWVAFARTGKPDCKAIPHWPAYDSTTRATMVFNLKSSVVNDPNSSVRKLLMGA
jgi:para-nitrobenzyl esterase